MADWATISALATAGGTLVLAGATFLAVRSSHASARITERALLASIRPVLVPSRLHDPTEKVGFVDDRWFAIEGGRAIAEVTPEAIYLVFGLRNVGTGLAVLDRWDFFSEPTITNPPHRDPEVFRRLTRDLYVPAGDVGFWQGAFRDPAEPVFGVARHAITERQRMTIDLLYGDHEGGQRTISRFSLVPRDTGRVVLGSGRSRRCDDRRGEDAARDCERERERDRDGAAAATTSHAFAGRCRALRPRQ